MLRCRGGGGAAAARPTPTPTPTPTLAAAPLRPPARRRGAGPLLPRARRVVAALRLPPLAAAAAVSVAAAAPDDDSVSKQQQQQQQERGPRQQQQPAAASAPSAAARAAYARDTLARMAAFCGPALLVPMGDPLIGFSDVVCVGQFASTAELSALGPATLALSFCTYAFQACQVATLALVSERLRARDGPGAQRALSTAVWLALAAGLLVALPLCLAPGAARAVVAATGCDRSLAPLAETYVRIRAAGLPCVLATMVAQAALLAQRDSRTPACAVVLGVLVNVAGNLVAVGWLRLGLAGAAGTTVLTNVAAAAALAALMWRQRWAGESAVAGLLPAFLGGEGRRGCGEKRRRRRRRQGDGDGDDESGDERGGDESDDAAALPPMPPLRPIPRLPSAADAAALGRTMGPLSVAYVCRNLCYLALQGAAAGLDVTRLAAHQAAFSAWNILSFASSPVEQAALAFVPAAAAQGRAEEAEREAEEEAERAGRGAADPSAASSGAARPPPSDQQSQPPGWWRVDATVRLVLLCGLGMGLSCGLLAAAAPSLAPGLFTPDAAVWPHMRAVAPQAFLSMLLIGVDVSCAGCLVAGRDLAYVARSYLFTVAVLWAAVGPLGLARTLPGVWWCLVVFFTARAGQSASRLAWLMRGRALIGGQAANKGVVAGAATA